MLVYLPLPITMHANLILIGIGDIGTKVAAKDDFGEVQERGRGCICQKQLGAFDKYLVMVYEEYLSHEGIVVQSVLVGLQLYNSLAIWVVITV